MFYIGKEVNWEMERQSEVEGEGETYVGGCSALRGREQTDDES